MPATAVTAAALVVQAVAQMPWLVTVVPALAPVLVVPWMSLALTVVLVVPVVPVVPAVTVKEAC